MVTFPKMAIDLGSRFSLSSVIVLAFLSVAAIWIVKTLNVLYQSWKAAQHLKRIVPHRPAHWLTGHIMRDAFKPGMDWLLECTAEYPRGFLLSIGPFKEMNMFVVNHPDHAQKLFMSLEGDTTRATPYRYMRPVLGFGIVMMYEEMWARSRKMLTGCFHFNVLKNHTPVLNEVADDLLKDLHVIVAKKETFPGLKTLAMYTMDSLLRTTFSSNYRSKINIENIAKVLEGIVGNLQKRWIFPWYSNDFIFYASPTGRRFKDGCEFIDSIPKKILRERKQNMKDNSPTNEKDFLEIILGARDDNNTGFTEREIIDQIKSFLVAGHETTAKVLVVSLYALAKHREHQEKCVQEIKEILKGRSSDHILWDDLNRLTYTTMCIKEAIRMYHMGTAGRTLSKPFTFDNMTLPAGTQVWWMSYSVYHNPTVFGDDHMEFKPSRFSKENEGKMHPFAFTPFAAGQRNCIGKNFALNELKVFISRMITEFEFEVLNEPKQSLNVKTRPDQDYEFRLTPRK